MSRKYFVSQWMNILILLTLLSSYYDCSAEKLSKLDVTSSNSTAVNSGSGHLFPIKHDKLEVNELHKKHSSTVVARKGVSLSDEETSSSSDSSSNSSSKIHSSASGVAQSPEKKVLKLDISAKNISNVVNETKPVPGNVSSVFGKKNVTVASTTAEPVTKPPFTSDDYSIADYDETKNSYSSNASSFLTTFSLCVIIVFLIVLSIVLFLRLKYKFSVHQNYRRVDYLIDGMYL
nr:PREDICTED: uncharacterized protein LOC109030159 [Bemisia tabaci]